VAFRLPDCLLEFGIGEFLGLVIVLDAWPALAVEVDAAKFENSRCVSDFEKKRMVMDHLSALARGSASLE